MEWGYDFWNNWSFFQCVWFIDILNMKMDLLIVYRSPETKLLSLHASEIHGFVDILYLFPVAPQLCSFFF